MGSFLGEPRGFIGVAMCWTLRSLPSDALDKFKVSHATLLRFEEVEIKGFFPTTAL